MKANGGVTGKVPLASHTLKEVSFEATETNGFSNVY